MEPRQATAGAALATLEEGGGSVLGTEEPPLRLRLHEDELISSAIKAELAESGTPARLGIARSEFRAERYERFAKSFSEAKVPDCLHADALKRQSPVILFVRFEGLYAVPFVLLAKVRGKCI